MKNLTFFLWIISCLFWSSNSFAVCIGFDGNGCTEYGLGTVPMPSGPIVERSVPSNTGIGMRQNAPGRFPAASSQRTSAPSSKSMVGATIVGGIIGGLLEGIFTNPEPAPGPTPEEIAAQRQVEEQQRVEEERRHQAFLKSKADLTGRLRGPVPTYVEDRNVTTTGGLALKSLPPSSSGPGPALVSTGETYSAFFGTGAAKPSVAILREPLQGSGNGLLSPEAYRKAISNPDLTQEERERLFLRMRVVPGQPNDFPMIDGRAFIKREPYSDLYLDILSAGAKAGVSTLTLSMVDEGGKRFLEARNIKDGYDELLSLGKYGADAQHNRAGQVVALGDYALTKAPSWVAFADAAVNAGGAMTRQAFIRYWAAKHSSGPEYVPNPRELGAADWNSWYSDQGEWTKAALDRVGAGAYK